MALWRSKGALPVPSTDLADLHTKSGNHSVEPRKTLKTRHRWKSPRALTWSAVNSLPSAISDGHQERTETAFRLCFSFLSCLWWFAHLHGYVGGRNGQEYARTATE